MIETRRLRLREPDERDCAGLERLFTDPLVMRHYPSVARAGAAARWLASLARVRDRYGFAPWTVETRAGEFIGQCGPLPIAVEGRTEVEIVCFFARAFWREGYSDEAGTAAIETVFREHGVRRIVGLISPENRPSRLLARRCGLRHERDIVLDGAPVSLFVRDNPRSSAASGPAAR